MVNALFFKKFFIDYVDFNICSSLQINNYLSVLNINLSIKLWNIDYIFFYQIKSWGIWEMMKFTSFGRNIQEITDME